MRARNSALTSLAVVLFAAAPPALGQDALAQGKAALAGIAGREKASMAGRLTIRTTDRRGEYRAGESLPETRRRLEAEPATRSEGTLVYGQEGWMRELFVSLPGADKPAMRTRSGESGGILRILIESQDGGTPRGKVMRAGATAPADAVLSSRVTAGLEGVEWRSASRAGEQLILQGVRGDERHEVVIGGGAAPSVLRWELKRTLKAPDGEKLDQSYTCEVEPAQAAGLIRAVTEWVINPPPIGNVTVRQTEVLKQEPEGSPGPQAVTVRFPAGTQITDTRNEVPLEYIQTEAGVNEDDVAGASRILVQGRAQVGEPAPSIALKDLKGNALRLSLLVGKPVLVFWFSTRSRPSEAAADFIGQLSRTYRKSGLQVIGLSLPEEEDAEERTEAFRKRFGWSFPVGLDTDGEWLRRFGAQAGVPKVAIVDPFGKLVYVRAGVDRAAIPVQLDRVVGGGKPEAGKDEK